MKKKLITWLAGLSVIIVTASLLAGCDEMQEPPKQTEPSTQTDTDKETDTEAHVHAFGSWTVATAATCTKGGTEVRTCPCGEKEERPLSALGHSFANEVCTQCGAQYSAGLDFTSNGDGTCYVSGIGACTDTDIRIPLVSPQGDSVTGISKQAFYGYTGLTAVTIPDSVTSIGEGAFEYCEGLTSINIPDSVTSIGESAFEYCKNLTSITIPDSVTSISSNAFSGTGYYNDTSNWEDGALYLGKHLIRVKSTLTGSYAIKPGTLTIAGLAFYDCPDLTVITIPDSVTSIGAWAFRECTSLASITIPDSVTGIGQSTFGYCTNLTSVCIGNSVTSIGTRAFSGCSVLTSITVPDSVTSIDSDVFTDTGYYNDTSNWEGGVLYIGKHLIRVKYIRSGSYEIKPGTLTIAADAFSGRSDLTSINIPDSVTSIGDRAFFGCGQLISITIPDSVTSIGDYAFSNCVKLTSITIPDGVTSIGKATFEDCTSLTSITIPDSVTSIGVRAFYGCSSLASITIPDSVTSIGAVAFRDCTNLTDVSFNGTMDQWNAIEIDSNWADDSGIHTIHCTDGDIQI